MINKTSLFLITLLALFWQGNAQNTPSSIGSWHQHAPDGSFGDRIFFNSPPSTFPAVNSWPVTVDCNQITPAPPFIEEGYSNLGAVQMANDLVVPINQSFSMESLSFNTMIEPGNPVQSVDLYYYTDSGDGPGTLMGSSLNVVPSSVVDLGPVNGFDHLTVTVDFDTPIDFPGNSYTTVYWVAIKISIGQANAFMEITNTNMNTPNETYVYNPNTQTFIAGSSLIGGDPGDGVLSMLGTCDDLEACSGDPMAGTITGPSDICADIPFNLGVTGASQGQSGLRYQWQKRESGGTWEDIADAIYFELNQNITEDTDYRFSITCNNGTPVTSPVFAVALKPANQCHCIPVFTSGCDQFGDFIKDFILVGENDTEIRDLDTTCVSGSYEDSTDQSVDLAVGYEYIAQIASGSADDFVAIWIDFNDNGSFDTDELVGTVTSVSGTQKNFAINIPADAPLGHFRMRVFMQYWQLPTDPCAPAAPWGMVRDYSVDIIGSVDCSGTPNAGTAAGPDSVCPNTPINLSVTGVNQASGLSYHWESSPLGQNNWSILPNSDTFDYNLEAGISEPTDFRFFIECSFSGEASTSNVITVAINAPTDCYCIPQYVLACELGDAINNVRMLDANGNLLFENLSGCSAEDGYGDYTDWEATELQQGKTYTLEIKTNAPEPENQDVRAWIDFGNDGIFDNGDEVGNSMGNGLPSSGMLSFEFTIPMDQDLDEYRLRIRLHSYESNPEIDPCAKYTYGEAEDYMVKVIEPLSTNDSSFSNFSFYPNPAQDYLNLRSASTIDQVIIYNLLGQQLHMAKPEARQAQIDLQSLATGSYIMKVIINGNEKSFKILKN